MKVLWRAMSGVDERMMGWQVEGRGNERPRVERADGSLVRSSERMKVFVDPLEPMLPVVVRRFSLVCSVLPSSVCPVSVSFRSDP